MKTYPENVTEDEMKPNASWSPNLEGDARICEHWYWSDGSIIGVDGKENILHLSLKNG